MVNMLILNTGANEIASCDAAVVTGLLCVATKYTKRVSKNNKLAAHWWLFPGEGEINNQL